MDYFDIPKCPECGHDMSDFCAYCGYAKEECPKCKKMVHLIHDFNDGQRMCSLCYWVKPDKEILKKCPDGGLHVVALGKTEKEKSQ